ncbi:MAG: metal-sensing transcriptional repressor [Clostridiales bacterium]|nr:metal-sensing transcriptional repressor [Clostridiales bacterium]
MEKIIKHPSEASIKTQKSMINRLNRVEGQIRGIKNMIEKEIYCDDIINQLEASRSALHSIQILLLESHIKNCVADQIEKGDKTVIDELLKTIRKITK